MDVWVEDGGDGGSRTLTPERAFDGQQELPFWALDTGMTTRHVCRFRHAPQARS